MQVLNLFHASIKNASSTFTVVLLILSFFGWSESAYATHNRAGEITYIHAPTDTEPFRYEFNITTYTNTNLVNNMSAADRDSLEIFWGDNTSSALYRDNGPDNNFNGTPDGENLGNGIRLNTYRGVHVYPGFAPFYVIGMQDPNRNDGIVNITASVTVPFYIEDTLFIPDPQFFGYNSSPVLSLPPIDYAQVGYPFIHNPTAFDPDGDELYFELIVPLASQGAPVVGYVYPDQVLAGPNNNISINSQTGELVWDSPQMADEYNVAILITEYRNGIKVGTMIRDMQIFVEDTGNEPPDLSAANDTCIRVGETLNLNFIATDDAEQAIQMTAFGAPFEFAADESPAEFDVVQGFQTPPAVGSFAWNVTCDHIFSSQYTVVVKAEDNFVFPGTGPLPLTDIETWLITVVPPPVTGVATDLVNGNIEISWDDPYFCATSEKFIGFSVWRKIGCEEDDFDECQMGLEGTGYTKVAERISDYSFVDLSAERGPLYAYRVVAEFSDANSLTGFPINISESYPSDKDCNSLPADVPIMTNVSVIDTDANDGIILIGWIKPQAEALDTIINLPPYIYELHRSPDKEGTNFSKITEFTANSFSEANDTVFIDTSLDTENTQYSYKVIFYSNGNLIGEVPAASSIFISFQTSSNSLRVTWDEIVPWQNQTYDVYRSEAPNSTLSLIATVSEQEYLDIGLENGEDYCYFVKATGTYFNPAIFSPLINDSQESCGIPIDTVGPCPPMLMVENDCSESGVDFSANYLTWTDCGDDDVVEYQIYFSPPGSDLFEIIATTSSDQFTYDHEFDNLSAGCYLIRGIDVFGNEGVYSDTACVETCLRYELPNSFTPNADEFNDVFMPLQGFRFVSKIEMKIFDRWGTLVFETADPVINWNGDNSSGGEAGDGVYYYTCRVFEQTSAGEEDEKFDLSGYIHLFRN